MSLNVRTAFIQFSFANGAYLLDQYVPQYKNVLVHYSYTNDPYISDPYVPKIHGSFRFNKHVLTMLIFTNIVVQSEEPNDDYPPRPAGRFMNSVFILCLLCLYFVFFVGPRL